MIDTLFKNKYQTRSIRLKGWDYSANGKYFVTICTKNRQLFFGNIKNKTMHLSKIGTIASQYWQDISKHCPNVKLYEFIIMPNHVHGIIEIANRVETQNFASLHDGYKNKFGPQSKNLSSIIRGFKIGVKKWATMHNENFQWQSSFYDHIIRNDESLDQIRQYIIDNPMQWEFDRNNPDVNGCKPHNAPRITQNEQGTHHAKRTTQNGNE